MTARVISFPAGMARNRRASFDGHTADLNALAGELGSFDEWLESAVSHLRAAAGDDHGGAIMVSRAAVQLILDRLDCLGLGVEQGVR